MRAALTSAGPAVFASAATVIAALFCLSIARVNGTSGLGPLGALGVALRRAVDADAAARAAADLRPPRVLAVRAAHAGDAAERGRALAARRQAAARRRARARWRKAVGASLHRASSCCR